MTPAPEPVVVDYDFLRMKSSSHEEDPPVSMVVSVGTVRSIVRDHERAQKALDAAVELLEEIRDFHLYGYEGTSLLSRINATIKDNDHE